MGGVESGLLKCIFCHRPSWPFLAPPSFTIASLLPVLWAGGCHICFSCLLRGPRCGGAVPHSGCSHPLSLSSPHTSQMVSAQLGHYGPTPRTPTCPAEWQEGHHMGTLFPCPDPLLWSTKKQKGKGLCWSRLRCSCCSSSGVAGLSMEEAQ